MSHFIKFVSNMLSGKTGEICSSENKTKREGFMYRGFKLLYSRNQHIIIKQIYSN